MYSLLESVGDEVGLFVELFVELIDVSQRTIGQLMPKDGRQVGRKCRQEDDDEDAPKARQDSSAGRNWRLRILVIVVAEGQKNRPEIPHTLSNRKPPFSCLFVRPFSMNDFKKNKRKNNVKLLETSRIT